MTAQPLLPQVSTNPDLDLPMGGCMGKISSVALGLALAMPQRKIFALDGDGSLLMNLGTLITVANAAPANLIHFIFENGIYRTTGGQPIPEAGKFNFTVMAEAAGYSNTHEFSDLDDLRNNIGEVINQPGPTFVCLKTVPANERPPFPFPRTADAVVRFRTTLKQSAR